ncbi:MAG: hypothetical protein KJI69_02875 [Patescibacteria group bacterium]|nr:hypothetical protein [Patescibacteria group bacterium]
MAYYNPIPFFIFDMEDEDNDILKEDPEEENLENKDDEEDEEDDYNDYNYEE